MSPYVLLNLVARQREEIAEVAVTVVTGVAVALVAAVTVASVASVEGHLMVAVGRAPFSEFQPSCLMFVFMMIILICKPIILVSPATNKAAI
eukprot:SAG31_NODE_2867_length_4979_cov_2.330123_1_plen_92_part_00